MRFQAAKAEISKSMSAFPSPVPQPESAPPQLPAPSPSSAPGKAWLFVVFLLLCAVAAGWTWHTRQKAKSATVLTFRTVKAVRGTIDKTRRVAGSIVARNYSDIFAPILQAPDQGRGLVLIYLAAAGSAIREGELLARIDNRAVLDHLDDVEAQVLQAELDIRSRKAQYAAQMENLQQRVRAAKGTLDKAIQDARAAELKPAVTQETLKLAVSEAEAVYNELRSEIPLMVERQRADLRMYELSYEHQVMHLNRHKVDAERCEIKSPRNGMVVLRTTFRNGQQDQVKLGDELAPGQPFMRIVDPAEMLLDASMSQTESETVRIGQPAVVRFDAFPDLMVHGRVQSVGALAIGGRRVNYYVRRVPLRIAFQEQDPRVISDLTASADIAIGEEAEGVILPREAILSEGGKSVVYVKQEDGLAQREVEVGGWNNTQAAVVSGLESGEEVVLDPHARS
jgi:multidrug efflux pump subunit AcrA (membrane-fusion protein)